MTETKANLRVPHEMCKCQECSSSLKGAVAKTCLAAVSCFLGIYCLHSTKCQLLETKLTVGSFLAQCLTQEISNLVPCKPP